jgi:2-polyprenyl-3-methyl-5-hydroxy-6-metoxy-1,4-benzoquinol methylase
MLSINARARAAQAFDEPAFEETLTTDALTWQRGIWDDSSEYYSREIATRFAPIVDGVIARAALSPGLTVLDLGTGTGSVAMRTATLVAPGGSVMGVDISREMLAEAQRCATTSGITNVSFREGAGEAIPAGDGTIDVLLASLSVMYMIDRAAGQRDRPCPSPRRQVRRSGMGRS